MKRPTKYTLFIIGVAGALAVAGTLAWLAGTTEGARWLLASVSRHTALKIAARQVEGRIFGHLRLAGVRVALPRKEMELDSLELRWQPLLLLAGEVAVKELTLRGVRVRDDAPVSRKPPDLAWPRVPGIAALLDGRIAHLQVDGLSYRHLDAKPVAVAKISTSLAWRDQFLSLDNLTVVSAQGRVTGNVLAAFRRPSLRLDLAVSPAGPVAGMNLLSLKARLLHARAPEQVAGSVTIAGMSGAQKRLELAGEVGMTRNSFNLRDLRLTRPGRRGTVSGEGTILLTALEPVMTLRMNAAGLDLAPELNMATDLSGELAFAGSPARYRGRFTFANQGKGWRAARVAGTFQGDAAGMKLAPLDITLLDGAVQGDLAVGWRDGVSLSGAFRGRKLNPAGIAPDWTGEVNLDLRGNVVWSKTAPLRGEVRAELLESRLHGRALTGELRADYGNGTLTIGRLALRGKGFDIRAAGDLDKRLAFFAQISDFSRLVPRTAGELRTEGWVSWRAGIAGGSVTGHGRNLAADGMRIAAADLAARLEEGKGYPLRVTASLRQVAYGRLRADAATLEATGTALRHTVDATLRSTGAELRLALSGAYRRGSWQGEIVRFSGRDSIGPWSLRAPARLAIATSGMSLTPLTITGVQSERLELAGELTRKPMLGFVRAQWDGLNLARATPWLKDLRVAGSSSGNVRFRLLAGERFDLAGNVSAQGTVTAAGHRMTVRRSSLSLDGSEHGLRAGIELDLAEGGVLKGTFSSPSPARLALPEEGEVAAEWAGLDLAQLRPWLTGGVILEGSLAGRVAGKLLPGKRIDIQGNSALSRGKLRWQRPEGELNVNLRSADVSWSWRGETLRGAVALTMAEYGQARGSFQLPLPARLPVAPDAKGAVQASLTGQVQEKGILTTFFPGFIQESHGELGIDLRAGGSWEKPQFEGELRLAKAGAYLPSAGIRVRDVQLAARLAKDIVRIDSFRAASGPGHLEGTAEIRLDGRRVTGYRGSISGERFQTVYLPELQLQGTPHLNFEGTPERVAVRGEVSLPALLVFGPPARAPIGPSKDVIIEGAAPPAEKAPGVALDIQVRVALGDRVLVKAEGIDAQLGGSMELTVRGRDNITSKGEIRVVKGRYKAYGLDLEIVRGRLFYAGGSINRPTLDILALRTIGDVRAGVTVGGTLQAPVTGLYSEPAMPDVDILAYLVLGHPLGASTEQASLLARSAGVLLSAGQSVVLQDQIKNRLGLSTLELQTGGAETSGRMGYKAIPVAPPGVAPTKTAAGGLAETMLTVGKYLTPKLYISYGRSLFTGGNLFRLRYDIFKHWQVETESGTESGADLYYKIDFD